MKLFIIALLALSLTGCDRVDPAVVAKKIADFEESVPALQTAADQLHAFAVATGSEHAIAAAASAKAALDFTVGQIPIMKAELEKIKGQMPWWQIVLTTVLIPFLPKIAVAIPGVTWLPLAGRALTWLAEWIANRGWAASATKKQKLADA